MYAGSVMRAGKNRIPEIKELPLLTRDVDIGFAALAVTNSNSVRITIPKNAVDMYDIRPGDQMQVKIIRLARRREKTYEDEQKESR
jgi:hypothetical protein